MNNFTAREPELARGILDLKARLESDSRPARARAQQVPHEEHYWILAQRLSRFRTGGGHLPARAHRRRGHAGLHRRGRAQYRSRPAGEVHRACCCFPISMLLRIPSFRCARQAPKRWKSWTARRCARWRTRREFRRRFERCPKARRDCWPSFSPRRKRSVKQLEETRG